MPYMTRADEDELSAEAASLTQRTLDRLLVVSRMAYGKRKSNQQLREMREAGMTRLVQSKMPNGKVWRVRGFARFGALAKFLVTEARREQGE